MLLGGDEFSRTQGGNNNAWCQDNEISWFDWDFDEAQREQLEFTKRLIALRREHPVLRRRQFLHGTEVEGSGLPDVWWFRLDGRRMTRNDWQDGAAGKVLGMFLNGEEIATPGPHGERIVDDSFIALFNAHHEDRTFTLPNRRFGLRWELELSTADPSLEPGAFSVEAHGQVELVARSLVLLRRAG
jgi:glycogen operon protein